MINFVPMKKVAFFLLGIIFTICTQAQNANESEKSRNIQTWKSVGPLGTIKESNIDTLLEGYNIINPAYKRSIGVQHLGNLGSACISQIFADRKLRSNFLFFEPYSLYYTAPEDILYFNTKKPYANISYSSGGPTDRKQENIKGIFAVNINPHFNMGMYGKWQNNYGAYNSQSTKNFNTGVFGSYNHRHNDVMANISWNGYQAYENGGFTDTKYITDPKNTGELDAYNIPTYFDDYVTSKIVNWNAYLNYKFNFGFDKTIQVNEDSTTTEFIPVSSIIYSFRNESDYRRYKETNAILADSFYYDNGYGINHRENYALTNDSVHFWDMKHTIGLSLNEEFNTFAKFGVAAYLSFEQKKYGYSDGITNYADIPDYVNERNMVINALGTDSAGMYGRKNWTNETQNKIGFGANISKHKGEHLTFNFGGDYYFKDEKGTNNTYNLNGELSSIFNIGKNIFFVQAHAYQKKSCPDFYEENYTSNRISWNYDFDNKVETEFEGEIGCKKFYFYKDDSVNISKLAPELGLSFKFNENIQKNYIYWNGNGQPTQYGDNFNVLNFTLKEQFKFWYLHFDNELTYQYTNADIDVIDLPTLCLFSNLYIQTKPLFKVLTLQIGADMRYNSEYYAPKYLPSTGAFCSQTETKIGNYPYYDLYLSFHLKSFRLFVEYNHFNKIWSNKYNYLITPGYALDPNYMRFGISVNFEN